MVDAMPTLRNQPCGLAERAEVQRVLDLLVLLHQGKSALKKNAVYLFMVPYNCTNTRLQGFMPFNRQFGFVFTSATGSDAAALARTAAHELAHGTFNLRHTFSPENEYVLTEGTTDNLMDYPSTGSGLPSTTEATRLNKYQWDLIHNPRKVWFSWLEEEKEGEYGTCIGLIEIEKILYEIRKANIDGKEEIKLKLFNCYEEYVATKLKLEKYEFSGVKISITGNNRFLNSNVNSSASESINDEYIIKPSKISKTSYVDDKTKIEYIKYQFHELEYNVKSSPYDKKTPTGIVRIEINIMKKESKDFEEYLYPQEINLKGMPYLSQLDTADTRLKTGCTTG